MTLPNPHDPAWWDKTVANYEAQAAPFTGQYADAALDTLNLAPGARMLDVATGTGAAALAALKRGAVVTAIDFSAGMIARVNELGLAIDARVMDGEALTFADASFDAAVSVFGVMLFPDCHKGLAEMARVVKPGGRAAVAVWQSPVGAGSHALLTEMRAQLFPDLPPVPTFGGLSELADKGRLREALQRAGFADVEVGEATHDFQLKTDVLDDAESVFATMPPWVSLNDAQRTTLLRALHDRAAHEARDGVWPLPSTALIASGRRP